MFLLQLELLCMQFNIIYKNMLRKIFLIIVLIFSFFIKTDIFAFSVPVQNVFSDIKSDYKYKYGLYQKLASFLANRGFPGGVIKEAIGERLSEQFIDEE